MSLLRAVRSLVIVTACLPIACKKPVPKLRAPVEVDAPGLDKAALSASQAARDGRSGFVKLKYCVDTEGKTHDVEVAESFDPEIDALAVDTVEAWTYQPATRDGEPYDFCTDISIEVRLGDSP